MTQEVKQKDSSDEFCQWGDEGQEGSKNDLQIVGQATGLFNGQLTVEEDYTQERLLIVFCPSS